MNPAGIAYTLFFLTLAIAGAVTLSVDPSFLMNYFAAAGAALLPNAIAIACSVQHARRLEWRSASAWMPFLLNALAGFSILLVLAFFTLVLLTGGFKVQM